MKRFTTGMDNPCARSPTSLRRRSHGREPASWDSCRASSALTIETRRAGSDAVTRHAGLSARSSGRKCVWEAMGCQIAGVWGGCRRHARYSGSMNVNVDRANSPAWRDMMQGYITLATGDRIYLELAMNLALSLKLND